MNLSKGFSDSNVDTGKISFGLHQTNLLKATIYWAQVFRKISRTPSLIGTSNAAEFRAAIEASRQRASTSKHIPEESASISKVSDPG